MGHECAKHKTPRNAHYMPIMNGERTLMDLSVLAMTNTLLRSAQKAPRNGIVEMHTHAHRSDVHTQSHVGCTPRMHPETAAPTEPGNR